MFRTWASITFKDAVVCCKSYIYSHIFCFYSIACAPVHIRTHEYACAYIMIVQKQKRCSFEHLKFIALLTQPFYTCWQCRFQFIDTLERIVECDDGTVASIALHISQHIFCRHPLGIVSRDKIPHHYAILST